MFLNFRTLPLGKIPGVGKVSAAKLEAMGLRTCEDVQKYDLAMLLKRFGKFGRVLWERSGALMNATSTMTDCANQSASSVLWQKIFMSGLNVRRLLSGYIPNWNDVWPR